MKDRLLTLALAAGAFALFYAFFVPKPSPAGEEAALPLTTETRADGYQALWRWLRASHIPTDVLHQPFTRLDELASRASGEGQLLITTLPYRIPVRAGELTSLDEWVGRGNTLLVLAALDDTPRWALSADAGFLSSLGRMTRLKFETIDVQPAAPGQTASGPKQDSRFTVQAMRRFLEPQRLEMRSSGSHPLMAGVGSVLSVSEFPASRWQATAMDESSVLTLARRADRLPGHTLPEPMIWLKRAGRGQILVVACASVFSNKLLGEQDNARLLSNIVGWLRGPNGAVIFDDDHQGAVDYYDAKAFFGDPRLHRTLVWMVLLWLLFVMGWQRLRSAADAWHPVDVTSFIAVTGSFLAGSVTTSAAALRLFENFFNAIRHTLSMREDGAAVWEWLAADARTTPPQLAELQQLHRVAMSGGHVDLIRLQNLLARLKGSLA